ncbi:hypothetical protein Tco_0219160 [Tanacetum coccineum]
MPWSWLLVVLGSGLGLSYFRGLETEEELSYKGGVKEELSNRGKEAEELLISTAYFECASASVPVKVVVVVGGGEGSGGEERRCLGKISLDVDFFMERGMSPSTDQFSWSFIDSKLFSRTLNTSKLFSRIFNASKLFSEIFKKCRVLKLQALA